MVLAVHEEGKKGHLNFICLVGHAFSAESLVQAKEEQLENALWVTVELYEEVALLHEELSGRARHRRAIDGHAAGAAGLAGVTPPHGAARGHRQRQSRAGRRRSRVIMAPEPRDVVVIGGSAGAVEALLAILAAVQHLARGESVAHLLEVESAREPSDLPFWPARPPS